MPELGGEIWVGIARADYQRIYRDGLEEVCQVLKETGVHDEIQRLTGVAAKLVPFDEWQIWQQECLVAQGRIQEAYELYWQVEKLYMTELDALPPERMRARFKNPEKETWRRSEHIGPFEGGWGNRIRTARIVCHFQAFSWYNLVTELSGITGTTFCPLLCTLSNFHGRTNPTSRDHHQAMEQLKSVLERSLRGEDRRNNRFVENTTGKGGVPLLPRTAGFPDPIW